MDIHKLIHLDLKGAPPKPGYLANFFPFARSIGITGILLEWEDTFPYRDTDIIQIGSLGSASASEGHYTQQEALEILDIAKQSGLFVIPLVQTFGHMEFALKHNEFKQLREIENSPSCLCPSQEGSLNLVKKIVNEIVALHEHSDYIHIGADEVWHMGFCEACKSKASILECGHHILWLNHVTAVAQYIKSIKPMMKIIVWDDMLRNIDEYILQGHKLGSLVEPMVWYYHTDNEFFQPQLWNKYCNVFPNIWAASAFKGATGSHQIMPIVHHHIQNQECWIRGLLKYDHYATLCEVLPCGIPSLFLSLITLQHGKFSPDVSEFKANKLGYIFPKYPKPDNEVSSEVSLNFPGFQLYSTMERLDRFIKIYKQETDSDRFHTWFNPWQVTNRYINPAQLASINATIVSLIREAESIEENLDKSMVDIFYDHTVDEIKGTLLNPIKQNLHKLRNDCDLLIYSGCTPKPLYNAT